MRSLISPNRAFWSMITLLVGLSIYFVTSVELRRRHWKSKDQSVVVKIGEEVKVLKVIDGDEVSVQAAGGSVVVRMLGIKSFKPNVNEPGIAEVGAACKGALQRIISGKKITVEFEKFKKDKAGRVLAYLSAGGADVGLRLVRAGHAMTFTRYPFSREPHYLAAELEAKTRTRGLWANPKAVIRATALKATWEATRHDD